MDSYKRLVNKAPKRDFEDIIRPFKKVAYDAVDNDCLALDGSKLIGEAREGIAVNIAYDMSFGAELKKPKYLIMGAGIGAIVVSAGFIAGYTIKKLTKKKEES